MHSWPPYIATLGAFRSKVGYFIRAAAIAGVADRLCPSCGSRHTKRIARKYLVTSLYECDACALRFRVPKDSTVRARRFYERRYNQGFTTRLPEADELGRLLTSGFVLHEKDYTSYVSVLKSAGLPYGASVLDFGMSWGYGSFQLREAGFQVLGYEVDKERANFAAAQLGIKVVHDLHQLTNTIDCLFSAHVMEHLADPNEIWRTADRLLAPRGLFVAFVPNGNPRLETAYGRERYHQLWGQVHPLLITPAYLKNASARYGFDLQVYSSPYSHSLGKAHTTNDDVLGEELAMIAWRRGRDEA